VALKLRSVEHRAAGSVAIKSNPAFAPYAAKGEAIIVFYGSPYFSLPRPFSADDHLLGAIDHCGLFNCQIGRTDQAYRLLSEPGMTYRIGAWPDISEQISKKETQFLAQRA